VPENFQPAGLIAATSLPILALSPAHYDCTFEDFSHHSFSPPQPIETDNLGFVTHMDFYLNQFVPFISATSFFCGDEIKITIRSTYVQLVTT
jgi:hypothetical protein